MLSCGKLCFTAKDTATLFAWVSPEGSLRLEPAAGTSVTLTLRKPGGEETDVQWGEILKLASRGILEITLKAPDGIDEKAVIFTVYATDDVYPFVIPGPGIVPSHFPVPEPTMMIATEGEATMWVDVPDDLPKITIGAWMPSQDQRFIQLPDGAMMELQWNPDQRSFYHVAEVDVQARGGWWQLHAKSPSRPFRWTVWEGLPMFLRQPPKRFPYSHILCRATDEDGKPIDARFRLFRCGKLTGIRDEFADTQCTFYVPSGPALVQASRGIEFERSGEAMFLAPGETKELTFRLRHILHTEPGWVCGDHHIHSYFEDGGQSPEKVVRAARGEGLNYMFLTDEVEPLLEYGLNQWDEAGRFYALPGQEVATDAVHMNALNTRRSVSKTSNDIGDWLKEAAMQSTPEHPTTIMLNHPSHITGIEKRLAYFRSWWVADKYDQVVLVENYDFPSWFERLNRGHRLTGLWTTDGHDVTYLPPGKKRTYVFVGNEFNEKALMEALMQGCCFNTRYPGAWLTLTVNGAMVGHTATPDNEGMLNVAMHCEATRPIDRVELIADGEAAYVWHGNESLKLTASIRLGSKMRWLSARAFVNEKEWVADGHSMEPLLAAGCVAFTNPVWVEH